MRLFFLLFFYFMFLAVAQATHIVGGEMQLKYITGNNYQFTLNMYFDNINGNPGALDQSIKVTIFEKKTDIQKSSFTVGSPESSPVPYTNIACTNSSLSTNKIVYTTTLSLSPNIYNSPNGYYMVWERCCRNSVINNIIDPGATGQTFYLEFPAVVRNGQPFRNSSPGLFPPVSDYACINELFEYNFSGQDPDGDVLVYDMVTPLKGWSGNGNASPAASPAPYPPVLWTTGITGTNQIPGNPTINITATSGLLSMRPSMQGLFVFGVRCSEYRDGVKIGEVRRDFQILVLNCPTNDKPTINIQVAGSKILYREGTVLQLDPSKNRCLQLLLSDPDPNELLSVTIKPVNFIPTDELLTVKSGIVNRNGIKDTLKTNVCFPVCFDTKGKIYIMDVIVTDDGCSLPKQDIIRVSFQIDPKPNMPPIITTTAPKQPLKPFVGEQLRFNVTGYDVDNDVVSLSVRGINFDLATQDFSFLTSPEPGETTSNFSWKINCYSLTQPSYLLQFKVKTLVCGKLISDSTTVEVQPQYLNHPPNISSTMAGKTIDVLLGTLFTENILGTDIDKDMLHLSAEGEGFNLADYGMAFSSEYGEGLARATLKWQPDCTPLDRSEFKINFKVKEDACRPFQPSPISITLRTQTKAPDTFFPANIFTPNQDGKNDYFELPNLPPEYCTSTFSDIQIFNRWGNLVYKSFTRDFKWDGRHAPDGVYFYVVSYSDRLYKGTVTKVR